MGRRQRQSWAFRGIFSSVCLLDCDVYYDTLCDVSDSGKICVQVHPGVDLFVTPGVVEMKVMGLRGVEWERISEARGSTLSTSVRRTNWKKG